MKHSINSTSISSIEETTHGTIIVEFKSRVKYEYTGVPQEVLQEFLSAPSVGRFFNEEIRGRYEEMKL